MSKLTSAIVVAAAASLLPLCAPIASAAPVLEGGAVVPLSSNFRACDFTKLKWVDATAYARPTAHVGTNGSGTVVATVDINTAEPNTHYDVRVIQTPRASIGCAPGAPGVLTGGLQTDAAGAGATTIQGAIQSGATGAWVIVERPAKFSQTPVEFYTSGFIASI